MKFDLCELLLKDCSTGNNIILATDSYVGFSPDTEINLDMINLFKPRVLKDKETQIQRTAAKAEVFTPSWICNAQNNLVDNEWFNRDNIFNSEENNSWITNTDKIDFGNKYWKDYVLANRMEITCGEAPYLVSPYDTTTGDTIKIINRIGLLDRKLRVVNENTDTKEEWFEWVKKAYQSTYGFEYQGDNLLIARKNLLETFISNYEYKFNESVDYSYIVIIANIIVWNIWQMDGLKLVVPLSCRNTKVEIINLFDNIEVIEDNCLGCKNEKEKHNGIKCSIMDWKEDKILLFNDLMRSE